jgi:hypothetical protein
MRRVEMDDGSATLTIPAAAEVLVDPEGWILMEPVAAEEQ